MYSSFLNNSNFNINNSNNENIVVTKATDSFFGILPLKKKKTASKKEEIDYYLDSEFNDIDLDPIEFWTDKNKFNRILNDLALELLIVPASSLHIESMFSTAKFVRNDKRGLNANTLNNLLLCKSNSDLL